MNSQTRITQLPVELQEVIHQMVHRSHMKDVVVEMKTRAEEEEMMYLTYLAFVGELASLIGDEEPDEATPEWA